MYWTNLLFHSAIFVWWLIIVLIVATLFLNAILHQINNNLLVWNNFCIRQSKTLHLQVCSIFCKMWALYNVMYLADLLVPVALTLYCFAKKKERKFMVCLPYDSIQKSLIASIVMALDKNILLTVPKRDATISLSEFLIIYLIIVIVPQ